MSNSSASTVRKIIGILFLIFSGVIMGGAVLVAGSKGSGNGGVAQNEAVFSSVRQPPSTSDYLEMAASIFVVSLVFSFIGVLIFGIRKWKLTLGWNLAGAGIYGLMAILGLYSIVSSSEIREKMASNDPEGAKAIEKLSIDLVSGLLAGGLIVLAGGALLWLEYSKKSRRKSSRARLVSKAGSSRVEKSESVSRKKTSRGSRPASVTIISWFIIVSSVMAFAQGIWGMFDPLTQDVMKSVTLPIPMQYGMMFAGVLLSMSCSIAMLKGKGWGRLFWISWTSVSMIVGLVISPVPIMILLGMVPFLVATVFLYRPAVSSYFSTSQQPSV
ncbi:MAG: hypothetical protein NZ935_15320 [Planctomycetes bacterium]|nr:hypothetical protein [Planctomycetota bacterium]